MKKGPQYSVEEAAAVFRAIGEMIDQNHELMNTEGVFRLSGEAKQLPNIIKKLLKNKDMSKDNISIHNLVGALKLVIKELMLLNAEDPNIELLREGMQAASSDPQQGIDAFNQVITNLAADKSAKSQAVAEILHTYVHLAQIASNYQSNNKMTPRNLAIASIGPVFFNNFPLIKNPIEMLTLSDVANTVGEQLIQNPIYAASFRQRIAPVAQTQVDANNEPHSDSDSPPRKRVQVEQGKASKSHLRRTMTFNVAAMKEVFKSEEKKERKHKKSAAVNKDDTPPNETSKKEKGRSKNR
ncbi:MAG: Rho GTPase-activating protein [Candidatus Berkiella sp.]